MLSVLIAIVCGVKYSQASQGRVLGINDGLGSAAMTSQTILDSMATQIYGGYGRVIFFVIMTMGALIIYQIVSILNKLKSEKSFGLLNILKIALMDILIFVLTVIGLASFNVWIIEQESPRELSYVRVSPETVRITWQSKHKTMSEVLWGYSQSHMDNVSLGVAGEKKVQNHEVIIEVNPNQEMYFSVLTNGVKYGESGSKNYYELGKNSETNQLYELKLKESK